MRKQALTWRSSLFLQRLTFVKKNLNVSGSLSTNKLSFKALKFYSNFAQSLHIILEFDSQIRENDYDRHRYETKNKGSA